MELRNGSLVGGSSGLLPSEMRSIFEHGVTLVLKRWTALGLAVENEWGGRESRQKADQMYQDILAWFYNHKEHYADDLEVDLEEIMLADFNVEVEDESPRQVSKELVALHDELLKGNNATVQRLQQALPADLKKSTRQTMDRDGTVLEGSDESSSGSDEEMALADDAPSIASNRAQPIIDDDGFQLVQSRRPGRAR